MTRAWRALVVCTVALVACGEGTTLTAPGDTTTIPATTVPATTTLAPTTTGAPTTTTAPRAYGIDAPSLFPPQPFEGSRGASGSGCVPDSTTVVPDGVWYGYVLVMTGTSITFDMACWFFGDIAYTEAAKDGVEVANDYYVRNQNPLTYNVPLHPDATMYWLDNSTGPFVPQAMPMADWPGPDEQWPCPGELCGVWIYVNDGMITEAIEQYVP